VRNKYGQKTSQNAPGADGGIILIDFREAGCEMD